MPRLSLWNQRKQNDFKFFDRVIAEQFRLGGTAFLVHKYLGVIDQGASDDLTKPQTIEGDVTAIQDLLLLENRDRKYDKNVYELRGVYQVQDNDFDLTQFGLFLSADVLYITTHINAMIDILGRKLMPGDVLEAPHLKDDTLLDSEDDGINDRGVAKKFYKVEEANRASEGFSPTWWPHIWRVRISPIEDSQEFGDLLNSEVDASGNIVEDGEGTGESLRDLISTFGRELEISDAIIAEAERQVPNRNTEHAHLYVTEENENGLPFLFMTDAIPPNGAVLLGCGDAFPDGPDEGAWFLRTDFEPSVLFKRVGPSWIRKEVDFRQKFTTANRILERFISNRQKVQTSTGEIDSKVGISKAVAPKVRPKPDIE